MKLLNMQKIFFVLQCVYYITLQCSAEQQQLPPCTCTTTVCQSGNSATSDIQSGLVQQEPPGKRGAVGSKGEKGDPCHCDVADGEAMEALRKQLDSKLTEYNHIINRLEQLEELPENCTTRQARLLNAEQENQDQFDVVPIYPIKFIGDITPWMVNCTKILSEGTDGWITIQRRQDGRTDFYRNWESYAKGFGNRYGEFWLGLRNIHKMTTRKSCKLRIDFMNSSNTKRSVQYSTFRIANEKSRFRLTISGYTGNIPDSMAYHNGQAFSTIDRDNDATSAGHCAQINKGGWWYQSCLASNLNGVYCKSVKKDNKALWWDGFLYITYVEMKLFCS